jgi:putative transcriptional regulator
MTVSRFGKELLESAREAVAISEGRLAPAGTIEFEAVDVAAIRKKLKLTQAEFAERFRLSLATLRDWEQNRRTPDRIAANLLRVIDRAPEVVEEALAG